MKFFVSILDSADSGSYQKQEVNWERGVDIELMKKLLTGVCKIPFGELIEV
jgi:hypothetical protein